MRSCSLHNLKLHHLTRRPGSDSCCPRPVWRGQTGQGESGVIKVADKTLQLQFCSRARWRWGLEFNQRVSARRNKKRGGKSGKMKQAALGRPRGLKPATSCGGLSSKTFLLVPLSGVTAEAASHLHFFFFSFTEAGQLGAQCADSRGRVEIYTADRVPVYKCMYQACHATFPVWSFCRWTN